MMMKGPLIIFFLFSIFLVWRTTEAFENTLLQVVESTGNDSVPVIPGEGNVPLTAFFPGRKKIRTKQIHQYDDYDVQKLRLKASPGFIGFVAPIYLGSPPQDPPFMVAFDTGRSNTWVYGAVHKNDDLPVLLACDRHAIKDGTFQGQGRCGRRNYYSWESPSYREPTLPPSLQQDDYLPDDWDAASFQCVDGSEYGGTMAVDSVRLGLSESMTVYNVIFLAVRHQNEQGVRRAGAIDGVVGLGTEANLGYYGSSIFQKMGKQGLMGTTSFSFYVSPSGHDAEITFGGHNKDLLAKRKKMVYFKQHPVAEKNDDDEENNSWSLHFDQLRIAGGGRGGGCLGAMLKKGMCSRKAGGGGSVITAEGHNAMLTTMLPLAFYVPYHLFFDLDDHFPSSEIVCDEEGLIGIDMRLRDGSHDGCKNWFSLVIDCDLRDSLNDLQMVIGKRKFSFSGKEVFPGLISSGTHKNRCSSFFGYFPQVDHSSPESGRDPMWAVHHGNDFFPVEDEDIMVAPEASRWAIGVGFMKKYYIEYRLGKGKDKTATPYIGIGLSKGVEIDDAAASEEDKKKKWWWQRGRKWWSGWGRGGEKDGRSSNMGQKKKKGGWFKRAPKLETIPITS